MVVFFNPKVVKSRRACRFPLSLLHVAAMLPSHEYEIVDANVDPDARRTLSHWFSTGKDIELLAVTVMPGPQLVSAMRDCRWVRRHFPHLPILWGGYFPSMYSEASLRASYVDFLARGQGEETLVEFLRRLRNGRDYRSVAGLSYKQDGQQFHNPVSPWKSPDEFPELLPYHKIRAEEYIHPSFLGARTAAHQASIGCPFRCNFCGVLSVYGNRQKTASPERTAGALEYLQRTFGVDSIQFYDNNFFLGEDHTVELCGRLAPLNLHWWCEGRVDILLRYSDSTWQKLRRSGCRMIFCGAESGSDRALQQMEKQLTTAQTVELARRARSYGIIPEFSFVLGNPERPREEAAETVRFIYQLKEVNPDCEIILYHYTPTPQRHGVYGDVDKILRLPQTVEEWARPEWVDFACHYKPDVPWLKTDLRSWLLNFETVLRSYWPSIQDHRQTGRTRRVLRGLAGWRYRSGFYHCPIELKLAQRLVALRNPREQSL